MTEIKVTDILPSRDDILSNEIEKGNIKFVRFLSAKKDFDINQKIIILIECF